MPEVSTQHDAALPPPEGLARGDFDLVVRRLADDMVFGTDASLFVGGGLEYASSRPYQIGDSVRLLNWRLTARTGRPYVRQYEALKRIAVYIVVDTSASMSVGSTSRSKHDIAVWMASALGLIAQRRMSPVAIVGAGERTVPITPSLIRNDLWRAIEPLRLGDVSEQTHLGERLERLTMRAGRRSVFVVISDLHDPAAIGALRHAAQKHDCMVIHTQDPAEITPLRAGFYRGQEAETGRGFFGWGKKSAVEAHRVAETHAELLRCGVDYLAVRTDESFIGPLRHFLASRGAAMRGRG
jgi:uncharacterized protein (DUF58 family)